MSEFEFFKLNLKGIYLLKKCEKNLKNDALLLLIKKIILILKIKKC
jgi:hypothetical protein